MLMGCEMPLIVTLRFLLGDGFAEEDDAAAAVEEEDGVGGAWGWAACGSWPGARARGALRVGGEGRSSWSASSLILTAL